MTQIGKELSMKEKAEAYDKALEKFHQFMDGYSRREISKEELGDIFPGFLEPEDEKIRKNIISYIKAIANNKNISPDSKKECKTWISWLEKQGENKKEIDNFDVLPGLYKCTRRMYDRRTLDGKILFEVGNVYKCLSKHDKAEFEVSYGQSVYLEDPVVYRHFIPYIEQDDPKPTDKTEPMFEVGDWVVNKLGNIWHIDSFDAKNYQVTTTKGEHNRFPVNIQNRMRPWTIRDAKDGDVLAEDTCIFILKKLNQDLSAKIYCCLYDDGEFDDLTSNLVFDDTCTYPATAEQRDTLFAKMKEAGYEWDPEKKEPKKIKQEPTDEPKFKVGDWITKGRYAKLIVGINSDWPHYMFEDGTSERIKDIDKKYHLWTIKDAKPGDVLVDKDNNIGIYKEIEDTWWNSYIYLGCNNCLYGPGIGGMHDQNSTKPATKERRDLLFSKIKEAGYEWDPGKKELKKIEQEPTDKIRPKFKVGDRIIKSSRNSCSVHSSTDDTICEVAEVHDTCYILNTGEGRIQVPLEWQDQYELVMPTWSEEDEEIINKISVAVATHYSCNTAVKVENWLKSFRSHLKQGWSKDDEVKLKSVCALIRNTSLKGNEGIEEVTIDWIKSLKDRVQSQSKQEWKQENTGDLTDFENAMMHIGESFFGQHAGLDPNDTGAVKEQANLLLGLVPKQEWSEDDEQYLLVCKNALSKYQVTDKWDSSIISQWLDNRLKSLKDRAFPQQQEWSEEEKGNVNIIVSRLEVDIEYWKSRSKRRIDEDKRVIDWLKSLRPQNTWKPSKEQIVALRWVLNNVPYNKHKEEISGLLDQIKDL